ncbi:MAG: hypothetical protein U0992_11735 [Planctomycetaceae bacterium]
MKYFALIVLIAFVVGLLRLLRRSPLTNLLGPKPLKEIDTTPDKPVAFGYKMSWLAVRASEPSEVIASLTIDKVQPANWATGVDAAYDGHTFISPSIDGWVFVLSHRLPELGHEPAVEKWTSIMRRLSTTHGEAQYFGTHRVSGFVAWSRWRSGSEERAFAYGDETLVDRGSRTPGEIELNHDYFDSNSPEAKDDAYWERTDLEHPDEEHVMEVAGKWSINPQSLEARTTPLGCGYIGLIRT